MRKDETKNGQDAEDVRVCGNINVNGGNIN